MLPLDTSFLLHDDTAPDSGAGSQTGLVAPGPLQPRPEAPTCRTVDAFGPVEDEVQALRAGAAILDASDAGRLVVRGADAAAFLHRLLANDVHDLAPGAHNDNLLLTSKGGAQVSFVLERRAEDVFALHLPPACAASCAQALDRYHFSEDLEIVDESADCAPLLLAGPRAGDVLARLGGDVDADPNACSVADAFHLRPTRFAGELAWSLDARRAGVAYLLGALLDAGARPAGLRAREIVRIEAGSPLFGCELDLDVYPPEVGDDTSFSLTKGCYIGQEVLAKLDTYGGLKRRLAAWRVDDTLPRARHTPILAADGERQVGFVTSWCLSPSLGTGLVLGLAKLRLFAQAERVLLPADQGETPGSTESRAARHAGRKTPATRVELPVRAPFD